MTGPALFLLIPCFALLAAWFFLPRAACLVLGAAALLIGIAVPFAVWSYANFFVSGDRSSYGMMGTLIAVLFAPSGLALLLLGLIKND